MTNYKSKSALTKDMRKFRYSLLINILLCVTLFSITKSNAQNIDRSSTIESMQSGTFMIKNGQAIVYIDKKVADKLNNSGGNYYVAFSYHGNAAPVSIAQKNNQSFIALINQEENKSKYENALIDFTVFVSTVLISPEKPAYKIPTGNSSKVNVPLTPESGDVLIRE